MSSDAGTELISTATKDFLSPWGVCRRLTSAYNPVSNGRAEVAIKSIKQFLRSNTDSTGILDTDRFLRAIMQLGKPQPGQQTIPHFIQEGASCPMNSKDCWTIQTICATNISWGGTNNSSAIST